MPDYLNPHNWHPAANAFPLLPKSDPERFQQLVENIRETGLVEPIFLYEGKVLDGRNRLLACEEAGIEPRFEQFVPNGVGPVQWIAAKHTRRDLTATQRAAATLMLTPLIEAEQEAARERQRKGSFLQDCSKGEALEKTAAVTGAGTRYVYDAQRIVKKDSSMLERMRDGEITLQDAKRQLGFKQTVAAINSDESYEWYTPKKYVEAARKVLGEIDLDPASCEAANQIVKADRFYTIENDGLKPDWHGAVLLNAPYGKHGPKFITKLISEYEGGRVPRAITVVNPHCTDAKWFQRLFKYWHCFTNHRPKFWNSTGVGDNPNHGTVFFYLGAQHDVFIREFGQFGAVLPPCVN